MTARIPRTAGRALRQLATASKPSPTSLTISSRALSTTATQYATAAVSVPADYMRIKSDHVSPTKPPSARPVDTRKSQLIRTYTSLLRTSPLILFFQHSNLNALEWAAVRRELRAALAAVPVPAGSTQPDISDDVSLMVLRTRMFNVALKIVSFYDPEAAAKQGGAKSSPHRAPLVHDLSENAYESMKKVEVPADSTFAQLEPLLVGPMAALVLPAVSPQHLAAALKILSPVPGTPFAAPMRRKSPGYYELHCQSGLSKLLLVGGRVEGDVFDTDGIKWVGGIENGLEGLRAQLVSMLQGAGLGLTSTLEAGSKSLWLALEGRKVQMEEEQGGGKKEGEAEAEAPKEESS
ncbi:hypothetical protein B0T11DRAFT_276639 [Plectosphaerella cucumerina]|uniref:Uncharacterized protein n=1 Tax=Plectosphaerella cucumerina TaxID=40658 RepID=A0A8K0TIM7_9PEZI|nr:hypothetical protein B0T11DRAFT_276639 [Plectosphaerella cucumerina]